MSINVSNGTVVSAKIKNQFLWHFPGPAFDEELLGSGHLNLGKPQGKTAVGEANLWLHGH
jgi:hypothetical protein